MLPVQRVTVGELWQLLTEERKAEVLTTTNGHALPPNGHVVKKGGKTRKENGVAGYWWSK